MASQDKTRYLLYENWPDPRLKGLDCWLETLEDFICIALNLCRVPIIPTHGISNYGKSQSLPNFRCEDYIDLTNTKIYKVGADGAIKRLSESLLWIPEIDADTILSNQTSVQRVNIKHIYESDNRKYKILSLTDNQKNYPCPNPHYYVKTPPSEKVNKLTDTVLHYFAADKRSLRETQSLLYEKQKNAKFAFFQWNINFPYACLNLYGSGTDKPKEILNIINDICENNTRSHRIFKNIYLISENRNLRLDSKRPGIKIYTYHDFSELTNISSNYLLYSVEKNIFDFAIAKIYPPGANKTFYSIRTIPPN